jgi:hypothetical protein
MPNKSEELSTQPLDSVDAAELADQRARAARAVASAATDATDCALLLDALGLRANEGLPKAAAAG